VAQGAELQLGIDLWIRRGEHCTAVYDEDVIEVWDGQEYLAVTTDDHGWPLPGLATEPAAPPPVEGWSLELPPRLWADLSGHLFADRCEHAAALLAERTHGPRGTRLLGRELIPATDDTDYIEGSTGYRSLTSKFIRDAVLHARHERLAYLAVHNHSDAALARFSHIDLASHERGYPALHQITGQPVGALVLTRRAATGNLWLPDGTQDTLTEVVVLTNPHIRLGPQPGLRTHGQRSA